MSSKTLSIYMELFEGNIGSADLELDYSTVAQLASLPLHCHGVEYPNKLNQVLQDSTELLSPSGQLFLISSLSKDYSPELHPIFYGCFDWHSSVHGHWLLARAAALYPDTPLANNVTSLFNKQFTQEKVEKELEYFKRKWASHFERTYGWAWLLKLQVKQYHLKQKKTFLIPGRARKIFHRDRQ